MALEAYMGVCVELGPLPWALGLPARVEVFDTEVFASLILGCRSATDLVRV